LSSSTEGAGWKADMNLFKTKKNGNKVENVFLMTTTKCCPFSDSMKIVGI
jgi:hypothetical protein